MLAWTSSRRRRRTRASLPGLFVIAIVVPGRSRAHDVGEPQPGAAVAGFEVEAPPRARVVGIGGAPAERARFVAGVDEARDRPLADGRVLVAPVEHGADAAFVAGPLGADELVGEPGRAG